MKAKIMNKEGKQSKEIVLPSIFSGRIRKDITQRYFETEKRIQPYAPYMFAGKLYSAAGKVRHARRVWKRSAGRGIARVPRKIFWRRGDQFYWEGATVSGTRGGRRAHPPKLAKFLNERKINKKEKNLAFVSAFSSTISLQNIKERYKTFHDKISFSLPLIISSDVLTLKSKQFFDLLKSILKENYKIAIKTKRIRAGKGKTRGRRYKTNAGLLFMIGNDEEFKIKGIEVKKVNEIDIADLWPLGRLTLYTEKAIKDLEEFWDKKENKGSEEKTK